MRGGLVVPVLLLTAACSRSFSPPAQTAEVRQEESRLATLIGTSGALGFQGDCSVRLLGTGGRTSWVWASCDERTSSGAPGSAVSATVRVRGDRVDVPRDGSQFSRDVEDWFPREMADTILHEPDRLRP